MLPLAQAAPDPTPYVNPNTGWRQSIRWQAVADGGPHHRRRNGLGAKRQVFYVNLGSFDTHNSHAPKPICWPGAHAIAYFDTLWAACKARMRRR
jgi:uncharacterized protein (DUF1501 family)